jgi:hypothetical protein
VKLFDPLLTIAAEQIFDLEKARIAAENRYRALTRSEADADGEVRGYGLDAESVEVRRLAALIEGLSALEHQADLNLCRLMRAHPLGEWQKRTLGVGEKQLARLLGVIGDPYWNARDDRPRTVSQLWAYCGLHVLPAGQSQHDSQSVLADRDQLPTDHDGIAAHVALVGGDQHRAGGHRGGETHGSSAAGPAQTTPARPDTETSSSSPGSAASPNPDQCDGDPLVAFVGVAARRRKGSRANWSTAAKTRAYLIAESCIKQARSPYRAVYDEGRTKYADAVHTVDCAQCKAKPGEPLKLGHQHARAMRLASKAVLRDLWVEAKRLHEGEAVS